MLIKNRMEIKRGNKVLVSFNNLLAPALEFVAAGVSYADFLAIGRGNKETEPTMETLEAPECVLPLVTDSFNFDPANGELFLTKKLVLDETNMQALEIVEVGLTGDNVSKNPKVANRFLANAGEPIYRDAGEEMTIEITVYLSVGEVSDLVLTAGSNNLVKLLLGGGGDLNSFYFARGVDETPNATIIEKDSSGLELVPAVVQPSFLDEKKKMSLLISADIGLGEVIEIALVMGDQVVARKNIKETSGVVGGLTIDLVADEDNMVTINVAGVNSIDSVVKAGGTAVADYGTKMFATSFLGGYTEVFSGLGYDDTTEIVMGRQGHKIGFKIDGGIRIYDFSSGEPNEHTCTRIDSRAFKFIIFEEFVFTKILKTNGTYDVFIYQLNNNNNTYYSRTFYGGTSTSYAGASKSDPWDTWDVCRIGDTEKMFLMFSTPKWLFAYRIYLNADFCFYSDNSVYSNIYSVDYVSGMLKTNRRECSLVAYDKTGDRVITYKGGSFSRNTDPEATAVAKNYVVGGAYPKIAKNYIYSIDKSLMQIKCYSIETLLPKTLDFAGAKDIYVSENFDYVGVTTDEGVRLYYVDGSLNLYPFNAVLPAREGAEIKKFEVMNTVVLVWFSDGVIMSIKLNLNKYIVEPVEKDTAVTVTYAADNTPGLSGEPICADATIDVEI